MPQVRRPALLRTVSRPHGRCCGAGGYERWQQWATRGKANPTDAALLRVIRDLLHSPPQDGAIHIFEPNVAQRTQQAAPDDVPRAIKGGQDRHPGVRARHEPVARR